MPSADGNTGLSPLTDAEFAARLAALGPFEREPRLAVAVSGGADSLVLALLAHAWARGRGGEAVALTVDHRLRAESAAEVRQVHDWLTARGVAHDTLSWDGPHPASDVQAAARAARYQLLEAWCGERGCLHLLTAHHLEDRAETFWLRLARGSGLNGLAGMPAGSERAACRVLRPLLDVPPERLRERLRQEGQPWLEDPSNRNAGFARVRMRNARAVLASEGLGAERLGETLRHLGRARQALEAGLAGLLARAVTLHPAGFAWIDAEVVRRAEAELGLRLLAAALATVGGADYPPRLTGLEALYQELCGGRIGRGHTLGGCRVIAEAGAVLLCREPAAIEPPIALPSGTTALWDGRFRIEVEAECPAGLTLGALGQDRRGLTPEARRRLGRLPSPVRPSLAALSDGEGLAMVPALSWARTPDYSLGIARIAFRPSRALAPVGFTVV